MVTLQFNIYRVNLNIIWAVM